MEEALKVGTEILDSMVDKSVKDYVFRKKSQVTLMTAKRADSLDIKHIDPSLIFQRLLVVAKRPSYRKETASNTNYVLLLCHFLMTMGS
jgi:hypothetical protein